MEQWEIERIQAVMEKDEELRRLWEEHLEYERKIEELQAKRYLTAEEEIELKRLKKEKLAGKDKIYSILRKYQEAG